MEDDLGLQGRRKLSSSWIITVLRCVTRPVPVEHTSYGLRSCQATPSKVEEPQDKNYVLRGPATNFIIP